MAIVLHNGQPTLEKQSGLKEFSWEEIKSHNTKESCWLVVDNKVYDVTKFLNFHPGGRGILVRYSGNDCTKEFHQLHKSDLLNKYQKFCIGIVKNTTPVDNLREPPPMDKPEKYYGSLLPFCDPPWYQGWNSPYFKETHYKFRDFVRQVVTNEIEPHALKWDEARRIPKEIFENAGASGLLACSVGPPYPVKYVGDKFPVGPAKDFDMFHLLILIDELSRCGSAGVLWGLTGGLTIGLPPLMHYGPKGLKEKVCSECLNGKKVICLCITEPWGGSDVANLRTTAKKTADGKHYVVNGEKKWITNGILADYFTVAVRTGGKGMGGVSMILMEKGMPGIEARQMKCTGVWPSGTTYLTFEDVLVPVENIIGKENEGFKLIMSNFNMERYTLIVQTNRLARVCVEEALKWALKRETFGKRLVDHPIIRTKLSDMSRQVEATHHWIEAVTYQLNTMSYMEGMLKLAGSIAMLKAHASRVLEFCCREAVQIFGGAGYTIGGQGEKVERIYREVKAMAIPGGSEEIMLDLGMRQAIKLAML